MGPCEIHFVIWSLWIAIGKVKKRYSLICLIWKYKRTTCHHLHVAGKLCQMSHNWKLSILQVYKGQILLVISLSLNAITIFRAQHELPHFLLLVSSLILLFWCYLSNYDLYSRWRSSTSHIPAPSSKNNNTLRRASDKSEGQSYNPPWAEWWDRTAGEWDSWTKKQS